MALRNQQTDNANDNTSAEICLRLSLCANVAQRYDAAHMLTWLKLIGSAKQPITGPPFYGRYDAKHVGFRKARKPGIRTGDPLLLYAPRRSRRIFALAEAVGDPERDANYNPKEEESCPWNVRVRYLINLAVSSGVLIDDVSSGQRT